jgi:hypothetical protein
MINIDKNNPIIGIYKITSPLNKIYIGQSIHIYLTWYRRYFLMHCKQQCKLYNSFQKYGVENHKFEIIEECTLEQLNEREIYWGLKYDVLGEKGLNLRIGNGRGKSSEETKLKISTSNKGKPKPDGFGERVTKHIMKGKKQSPETIRKSSLARMKPLLQYDINGNFIKEWSSLTEVSKHLNIDIGQLSNACSNPKLTAKKYKWRYKYP